MENYLLVLTATCRPMHPSEFLMLIAFVKPAVVGAVLLTAGSSFPNYSIEGICQSTSVLDRSHVSLHACRHDERQARDDLRGKWAQIPQRFREACTGSAISVSPTYTDLSGCIDGYTEVGKEKGAGSAPKAVDVPSNGVN